MRRSLATIFLTTTLVFSSLSTFPVTQTLAQRRPRAQKPTSASLASQRGADTITAAQLKDYLSFIASDEMEGRSHLRFTQWHSARRQEFRSDGQAGRRLDERRRVCTKAGRCRDCRYS